MKKLSAGELLPTELLIDGIRQSGVEFWRVNYSGGCHVGSVDRGMYVEKFSVDHWVSLELQGDVAWESPKYTKPAVANGVTIAMGDLKIR